MKPNKPKMKDFLRALGRSQEDYATVEEVYSLFNATFETLTEAIKISALNSSKELKKINATSEQEAKKLEKLFGKLVNAIDKRVEMVSDGKDGKDGLPGATPIAGIDYPDYQEIRDFIKQEVEKLPKLKSPQEEITVDYIKQSLMSLEGHDRLPYTAIDGIEQFIDEKVRLMSVNLRRGPMAITGGGTGSSGTGGGASVSDEAYGGTWDGVTDEAPSKNAIFDKIEALVLGSGTGDVVGPVSAVDDRIATFDTTTGKLIQDGGKTIAEVLNTDNHTDGTTNKVFTATEKTKLSGIETGADVTDTANVTSAGALMDSELADLTAVKTLQAPDNTTISVFGASLIDDADAATALTTLGLTATATELNSIQTQLNAKEPTLTASTITGKTAVTAVGTDYVLISDTSDSGNLKKALVSDFGSGGSTTNYINTIYTDQSGGTSDTYGVLAGTINGSNALFTVSQAEYATGTLKVWLNGQLLTQGSSEDWVETTPASGTFTFNTAPASGSLITAEYQLTTTGSNPILTPGDSITEMDATAHRLFYSDGSGNVTELAFGTSGQYLKALGTTTAPTWDTPTGSGSQSVNTEAAGSATLTTAELSDGAGSILNIVESNAASQTITLPTAVTADIGKFFQIYNKGTNKMTITSASTLNGDSVILGKNAGCVAYITADGVYTLVGTGVERKALEFPVVDWTTSLSTGDGKYYFVVPADYDTWEIVATPHARVITAGTTGTTDIQLHNVTDAVDVFSTKVTIDSTETGSNTAATPPVINSSNKNLAAYDLLRVDIDAVSTTAPQGLLFTIFIEPI